MSRKRKVFSVQCYVRLADCHLHYHHNHAIAVYSYTAFLVDSAISFTYTSNVAAVASKECVNIVKLIMYLILKA